MYRQVIKVPDHLFVDHINRNRLDNRKANLRPATAAQNGQNRVKYRKGKYSSKYKGVSRRRSRMPWRATIRVNGRPKHLGSFTSEVRAAKAYDRAAKKYHGEFAVLNFSESRWSPCRFVPFLAGLLLTYLACLTEKLEGEPATTNEHHRPATKPLLTVLVAGSKVALMAKKLYIIDGHAHIYAAYFAPMRGQLTSPAGEPTKAVYIFTMALLGLIERHKPDMLVVALDSKEKTFRHDIYPEYKANRQEMPDDLPPQIDRIEQILEAMNIPKLRLDGFEADDIIGTLAKKAAVDGHESLICSKDKDLLQLIDEHISTFDIKTDTKTDREAMIEKLGIGPEQFIDCLALQGDTSDNVPGIPDVGPKTALAWIQKYGSMENLYEHVDEIKGKRGDNLRKFRDMADMSKVLVTIDCDVPIKIDYDELTRKDPDKAKLAEIFTELGFKNMLARLGLGDAQSAASDPGTASDSGQAASSQTVGKDYRLVDTPEKFAEFMAELREQKLFAVDTETTSVNAMRADLVGMSFSWQAHQGFYL
ncbi:MAG: 5'-3' exonuclease H3TH domain-containing protein, partial [Planctomycetota bacterium]